MAAPSGTVWGSTVSSKGRIGIYAAVSSSGASSTVTVSIWFWSKYSVSDTNNTLYYNVGATSATTSVGSVSIKTTVATGDGWSTSNQVQLKSYSYTYTRGTSAQTVNLAAKLTNIDAVSGTMTVSTSFTVPKLDSYTVAYNANGGSGAPSSQTKWYGKTLTLSTTKPTRTGYTFKGWATSSSGSVAYAAGASYTTNAAVTLYAVWTAVTYTVAYNANGGSGAPSSQTKTYGVALTLSSTKPTRTNYTFKGWATSSSGSVAYAAGASYTANAAVTLYAVWELTYTLPEVTDPKASRCDASGAADETGLYALVTFAWATCTVSGNEATLSECTVVCNSVTTSVSVSGSSGSVSVVIGAGVLSVDSAYDITITLTDSRSGITTRTITLPTARFSIDIKDGGMGVAVGKVAEDDGYLDTAFRVRSTYKPEGTGRYDLQFQAICDTEKSNVGFMAERMDTGNAVYCGVGQGGVNHGVYSYTQSKWLIYGDDTNVYVNKRIIKPPSLLWSGSGAMYMTDDQTVELAENISDQENGIILVWKAYVDSAVQDYDIVEHFVHKSVVAASNGKGHNFFLCRGVNFNQVAGKYLYISDGKIVGNANNDNTGTGNSGITYTNNYWVLAAVYGV